MSLLSGAVSVTRCEVVARPPKEASTSSLTPEEILRRERQRIQEKGITLYQLAPRADVAVFDWRGDVYLVRPGQEPLRLTETEASEIDHLTEAEPSLSLIVPEPCAVEMVAPPVALESVTSTVSADSMR